MMWWNGAGYPGAWWMGIGMLIPLVVLVGLGIGIFLIVRAASRNQPPAGHERSGLDILKERYAKGEISRDDYLKMKQDIDNK